MTYGMSLEEFTAYYRERHGTEGLRELPERMARVEAKGTSSLHHKSAEDTLLPNRAGKNETSLSVAQIIEWYCVRCKRCQIEGERFGEDAD